VHTGNYVATVTRQDAEANEPKPESPSANEADPAPTL
jgi:hypothetical protein